MRQTPESATQEKVRISKLLAERGICSRREADSYIEKGWVKVDGQVAQLGDRAWPHQSITLERAAQSSQTSRVTILLHKPVGYVSGQAEKGYRPAATLVQAQTHWRGDTGPQRFQPGHTRGLAAAGRLDIDSTGLLVLTQDGRVARHLIGEDSDVDKEYLVRVAGRLSESGLALLNHGLSLDGHKLRPAQVTWQNEDQLRFVLREGRKRQIRRMCELVGLKVIGLKRVRIGKIRLGDLPVGQWRYLKPGERF
ncbi:pseudouridine synthase [Kerstersia sp.]|uniref:pseudouridine synthase n=1 Tax=Kerstersia sp. TaxID=1930783 RepID=UPI003F900FE0